MHVSAAQVQFVPARPVTVNPVAKDGSSTTVTVPDVGFVPVFFTTTVYVAPVSPCAKFPLSVFVIDSTGGTGV